MAPPPASARAAACAATLRLPGDKSISTGPLILAALADGESRIAGAADGDDVRSTPALVEALGATVERIDAATAGRRLPGRPAGGATRRTGRHPRLRQLRHEPPAAHRHARRAALTAVLDGDASLRRRPVRRIIEPLRRMGATLMARADSLPPLTVIGRTAPGERLHVRVPSAQVKCAFLLAGLFAEGETSVREPVATRDHTERMLRGGACLSSGPMRADGSVR